MIIDHAFDDADRPLGNGCQVLVPTLLGRGKVVCGRPVSEHSSIERLERAPGDQHEPDSYPFPLDWDNDHLHPFVD